MEINKAVELIRNSALAEQADLLIKRLLPSTRLVVDDGPGGSDEGLAVSRFGGLPSMPRRMDWPVWNKREYLQAEIERLEKRFKANPRATGLRDIASRLRQELPKSPVPLLFLGQLSLSEIHSASPLPNWPDLGTLLFFYDQSSWGFDPLARGHCRVLFFPISEELAPSLPPTDLSVKARFPHRRLGFRREWTLPTRINLNGVNMSIG